MFDAWFELENVHVLQASLSHIPVNDDAFDIVWCDGALPYVDDVERVITQLFHAQAKNGELFSWCYGEVMTLSQRLGWIFWYLKFPTRLRYALILIVAYFVMFIASGLLLKNKLESAVSFAEGTLDISLSSQVNHISEQRIEKIFLEHDGAGQLTTTALSKNQVVRFWVK